MLNAVRVDVNLIDKTLLRELSARADVNRRVPLTLKELSKILECHPNTVFNSANRLENSGYIKRLTGRGRGGQIYEVLCQPTAKQSSS